MVDVIYINPNAWQVSKQLNAEVRTHISRDFPVTKTGDEIEWRIFCLLQKNWHEAGVIRIKDVFQNNAFLPFSEFCSRFKIKANFLKYRGLCHSIPREWINFLKGNIQAPLDGEDNDELSLNKLSCKSATRYFVKNKSATPTAEKRDGKRQI